MIANTYVVKPFGISEVKVIALKGEPGGPTQEQVNTAVEEYMDDHPEAQIPDGAVTTEKLASNTVTPYADNLVSSSYVSDSEPYLFRKTFAGVREDTEIVGGSVVWNQLQTARASSTGYGLTYVVEDGKTTVTGTFTGSASSAVRVGETYKSIPTGHKVALLGGKSDSWFLRLQGNAYTPTKGNDIVQAKDGALADIVVRPNLATNTEVNETFYFQIFDLTLMFGSAVADYIYSIETATAGAGVAFFRSLFDKPYYAYNAGEIISVKTSAHKMVGFNQWDEEWRNGYYNSATGAFASSNNFVANANPIPVLPNTQYYAEGANFALYAYDANKEFIGVITRANDNTFTTMPNCAFINFNRGSAYGNAYNNDICINISDPSKNGTYEPYTEVTYPLSSTDLRGIPTIVDGKLVYDGDIYKSDGTVERRYGYRAYQSGDESLANAITDGTHTVYKLTTATTETTDPYTNPQKCYPDGTEEYIDTRDVPIPVGHNTKYMRDLKKLLEGIPDAPSANGTYVLKATVSASGVTYAWVEG